MNITQERFKRIEIQRLCFVLLSMILIIISAGCGEIPNTKILDTKKPETRIIEVIINTPTITATLKIDLEKTPLISTPGKNDKLTKVSGTPTSKNIRVFTPTSQNNADANPAVTLCHEVPPPKIEKPGESKDNIFLSGEFTLCTLEDDLSAFDLDQGMVTNPENPKSDITLKVGKATFDNHIIYYVWEVKDASVNAPNTSNPDYLECKEVAEESLSRRWQFILGIPEYFGCVKTNEGRVSLIKISEVDPSGLESLEISFVTWNN